MVEFRMVENMLHVRLSFFVFDAALLEGNQIHAKFNRTNLLIPRDKQTTDKKSLPEEGSMPTTASVPTQKRSL
jgi:hypothetical protein